MLNYSRKYLNRDLARNGEDTNICMFILSFLKYDNSGRYELFHMFPTTLKYMLRHTFTYNINEHTHKHT